MRAERARRVAAEEDLERAAQPLDAVLEALARDGVALDREKKLFPVALAALPGVVKHASRLAGALVVPFVVGDPLDGNQELTESLHDIGRVLAEVGKEPIDPRPGRGDVFLRDGASRFHMRDQVLLGRCFALGPKPPSE